MTVARAPLRVPHRRRSLRLRGFDYSREGIYFVTICVRVGDHVFGDVREGKVRLNIAGTAAANCWLRIPVHFPNVSLDEFIVMPNHVHGILAIHDAGDNLRVGAQHAAPLPLPGPAPVDVHAPAGRHGSANRHASPIRGASGSTTFPGVAPGSLGAIVRSLKSATTKRINEIRGTPGEAVWQRNYYDRIIRDDRELDRARRYIRSNPARWAERGSA